MKDGTEQNGNSVTLKEYLEGLIVQRSDAAEKAVQAALAAQKELTNAAFASSEKAICVAAATPVLCVDLIWRPAGDLRAGDEVVAFDENASDHHGRYYRRAVVVSNSLEEDELIRVTTEHGYVDCNRIHPWLSRDRDGAPWLWVKAADLKVGKQVYRPFDVWETDESWEAGWLAGMFDGEGHIHVTKTVARIGVSQNHGPICDKLRTALESRLGRPVLTNEFKAGHPVAGGSKYKSTKDHTVFIVGKCAETMKVIGSIRPVKLLARSSLVWEGRRLSGHNCRSIVTSTEDIGRGTIALLATSTSTYIAGGFAMHNTKAEEAQKSYNATHNDLSRKMDEQYKEMMPRSESLARHGANETRYQELKDDFSKLRVEVKDGLSQLRIELMREIASLRESRSEGAGEKGGRMSQQQLIMMIVSLVVALIVIGGAVVGIAFAIRKG